MKNIIVLILAFTLAVYAQAQTLDDYQKKGENIMNNGDYASAYEEFKAAIALDTLTEGNGILYSYAGICAMQLDINQEAITHFKAAINRGFADERLYEWLGIICTKEKDYGCQEETYLKAISEFPDLKHDFQRKLCNTYYYSKQYEKLLPVAQEVLSVDSTNIKVKQFSAAALYRLKKTDEALLAYEELIKLDPENQNANLFLGNYFYQVGKAKLDKEAKKYETIATPSRVDYHDLTKKNTAIIEEYYSKALPFLLTAYNSKPSENVKKMLFAIYTKKGDKETAEQYK